MPQELLVALQLALHHGTDDLVSLQMPQALKALMDFQGHLLAEFAMKGEMP